MDRVNTIFRTSLSIIIDDNNIKYHVMTMIILLVSETDYLNHNWYLEFAKIYGSLPLKLLAWPARITVLISPFIHQLPSFPDANAVHIILVSYVQIINSMMIGTSTTVNCGMHPYYCYEGVAMEKKPEAEVDLVFSVLRTVIFLNMAYFVWFMISVTRILLPYLTAAVDFARNEIGALLMLSNFIALVIVTETQNIVILGIFVNIIWWQTLNYFLNFPTMNILEFDFSILLEDYEIEDEVAAGNPEQENPFRFRHQYMDPIESDDEDLIDVE